MVCFPARRDTGHQRRSQPELPCCMDISDHGSRRTARSISGSTGAGTPMPPKSPRSSSPRRLGRARPARPIRARGEHGCHALGQSLSAPRMGPQPPVLQPLRHAHRAAQRRAFARMSRMPADHLSAGHARHHDPDHPRAKTSARAQGGVSEGPVLRAGRLRRAGRDAGGHGSIARRARKSALK